MEKIKNIFSKLLDWSKSHLKLLIGIIAIIVVAIVLIALFAGGPKKAVKKYIKALNSFKADKVADCYDLAGVQALGLDSFYNFDPDKFDYDDFIDDYKKIDKDDIKNYQKSFKDFLKDNFDELKDDYKSYKVKIEEFKDVEKLGKDMYLVKAKVSKKAKSKNKDDDEVDNSSILSFVVYKNKIVFSKI